MVHPIEGVVDVEEGVVGLGSLRLDGEGSSRCCGGFSSCGGSGRLPSLPGFEDEEENDDSDDKAKGEDVDEQVPVHLGGLAVVQRAGRVSGSGETGGGLAHCRSSTGVPGRLPCSFHSS